MKKTEIKQLIKEVITSDFLKDSNESLNKDKDYKKGDKIYLKDVKDPVTLLIDMSLTRKDNTIHTSKGIFNIKVIDSERMKKTELRKIIKEEILKLNESQEILTGKKLSKYLIDNSQYLTDEAPNGYYMFLGKYNKRDEEYDFDDVKPIMYSPNEIDLENYLTKKFGKWSIDNSRNWGKYLIVEKDNSGTDAFSY